MPSGTVHSACTDPNQTTAYLGIVLVSRIGKVFFFSNGKGSVGPTNRNDWTGQSRPPSKEVLNTPVGMHQNDPLYLISNQSFLNFVLVDGKRP